ncbi:uncharacterized protein [Aegilops tauschii subsp. strangulata]|uniref:uncharacterized protein isoform X1 n=1 Tax=Aegilops tauschii subsp. strangulata TaxID=200361 RepID=UPI003CC83F11
MSYAMDLGSRSSLVCLQWSRYGKSGGEVELGVEVNILNARKNSSLCTSSRSGLQSKRNGRPDLLVGGGGWRDGEALIVEGGVYDACDHACNICLEAFCDSDSSTVATSVLQMLQAASMICISGASLSDLWLHPMDVQAMAGGAAPAERCYCWTMTTAPPSSPSSSPPTTKII